MLVRKSQGETAMTTLDSIEQDLKEVKSTIRMLNETDAYPEELPKWKELKQRLEVQRRQYVARNIQTSS